MRSAALAFVLLVVVAGSVPVVLATPPTADPADGDSVALAPPSARDPAERSVRMQVDGPASQRTELVVDLRTNLDARWTVVLRYPLETENQTAAFRRLRDEFENGDAETGFDETLFRRFASRASEATDREMALRNVTREGYIENGTGVLRLSFTWTNFLTRTDGGGLRLGSALRTSEGTWLSTLESGQRLVVRTPPEYAVDSTSIRVRQQNNSVVVDGPRTFGPDDHFVVTYRRTEADDPTSGSAWDLLVGGGALVAAFAALVAALYFVRGRDWRRTPSATATPTGGVPTASPSEPAEEAEDASQPATDADAADAADEGDGTVDPSLLSDEEQIEHLLERNGGRMKQAHIVRETGWSDAKVSQLLSSMAEAERVNKLRLGRENLISLPDEAPADGDGE